MIGYQQQIKKSRKQARLAIERRRNAEREKAAALTDLDRLKREAAERRAG